MVIRSWTAIALLATVGLLAYGCDQKSEAPAVSDEVTQSQGQSKPDANAPQPVGMQVPPPAVGDYLLKHDGEQRGGQKSIGCSSAPHRLEAVVGAYPSIDFVAAPSRICTIRFRRGDIVDLLRINGTWTHLER